MSLVTGPKITGVMSGATLGQGYLTDGNRFLRMEQALIQGNVINQTTTTPPATPNSGDTYIVGTGATGAWSGKDTQIAYWASAAQSFTTAAWDFYVPVEGWLVYDQTQNYYYWFDGAAWQRFSFGGAGTLFTAPPAWWMLWDGSNYAPTSSTGSYGTGVANQLKCTYIRVPYALSLKYATTRVNSTVAAAVAGCGIYDTSGNRLAHWDSISTAAGAAVVTTIAGGVAVSLLPGIYIAACAHSDASTTAQSLGGFATNGSNEGVMPWNDNGTVRTGTAANLMVGGVVPATLGTISAGGGIGTLPCILLEP